MAAPSWIWPNGKIPYKFDSNADCSCPVKDIMEAMKTISFKTKCISFTAWFDEEDYLIITNGPRCLSDIGRVGGVQFLCLDYERNDVGEYIHELCHAIGLIHEHQRKIRDDYVSIYWDHIQEGRRSQFEKNIEYDTSENEFDFNSIMLYGERENCTTVFIPTMKAKDGRKLIKKKTLSLGDIYKIRNMYK